MNTGTKITECPVCGDTPQFLYRIERFTPAFDILRCPGCALEMQAQIPDDAGVFYDEDYYTGKAEYAYRDERAREKFDRYVHNARLRKIAGYVPAPADFVDVGAAFGSFVAAAADAGVVHAWVGQNVTSLNGRVHAYLGNG